VKDVNNVTHQFDIQNTITRPELPKYWITNIEHTRERVTEKRFQRNRLQGVKTGAACTIWCAVGYPWVHGYKLLQTDVTFKLFKD